MHVDDTRLTFTSDRMRAWFLRLWDTEFGEGVTSDDKLINRPLDEDFVGIKRHVVDEYTTQYSSLGVIKNLGVLISPYPLSGVSIDTYPMSANATRDLRDFIPDDNNPLVPDLAVLARKICGTIGFIVTHTRPDAYFAFCFLARYQGDRLTKKAFTHLLRLAWYLVKTQHLPLTIRTNPGSANGKAWDHAGVFTAWVDTSHGNADAGRSYGGFVLMHNGGGALAWKCMPHPVATDSPGAQELMIGTACYKYIMAMRMLLLDLDVPADDMGPTPMMTDSQIMLDGASCEKLVKTPRWLCARYAMIRHGVGSKIIKTVKVPGETTSRTFSPSH